MAKKLEVRHLTISFRTNNGAVRAVRDISFDLNEGETIAIAGESGSGKSVTTRAVMGILAGNAMVDDGEIIYDGRDLLKIPEEEFHTLRGHRLSMVFQDPLSALNPIMRIGKQLTEAMLLNNKERRADGKRLFGSMLSALERNMRAARVAAGEQENAARARVRENIAALRGAVQEAPEGQRVQLSERLREDMEEALAFSSAQARREKEKAVAVLEAELPAFQAEKPRAGAVKAAAKRAAEAVAKSIDPLALEKDNQSYVFASSLKGYIERYFRGLRENPKEERRFRRETEKHDRLEQTGREVPSVVPLNLVDTEKARANMAECVSRLAEHFRAQLAGAEGARTDADAMAEYLRQRHADSVYELSGEMAKKRALELMREVGIPEPEKRFEQYPFEFSGGMRQRIVIAIALSANPDILICDEPTTALDVTIQAQILELINRLKRERRLSVIFITHDLGVVANMADRIAIMYAGKIVELGTADDIFYDPRHPYTWALLASMPDLETKEKLDAIPGTPPNMILPPKGDAFAARNRYAMEIDFEEQPPMFRVSDTHWAATWLLHPDAPKVDPPASVTDRIRRMRERERAAAAGRKEGGDRA